MDCLLGVFEFFGIDIKGDIFFDLFLIKVIGQGGKFVNGRLCNINWVFFKFIKKNVWGLGMIINVLCY